MQRQFGRWIGILAVSMAAGAPLAAAQDHETMRMEHMHEGGSQATTAQRSSAADARIPVKFPAMLKEHTLANMRDHLQTLSRIQAYLAASDFDHAADIAEKRLGMSSLSMHGAHEVEPYMPQGMQEAGTAMHHAASQFALATQEAAINRDVPGALGALNKVTQACVACHAAYRLE